MITEWIEQAAARRGDAPYLEDAAEAGTLTYAGLRRSAAAWADRLDRAGIPPGERVAVRLPDPLSYATALVAILGAGRVVVPLDPGAPAAEHSRVLAAARPQAAVCDSGSGLPPGLTVLTHARRARKINSAERPGRMRTRRVSSQPGRHRGNLPVHERDHRRAQGHLAARGSAGPCRRRRGPPPPADRNGPRLLLSPAVPRQRRGGRIARHPGRGRRPGAGPQVQPPGILGADGTAADHLDQRGTRDHHRAGHEPSRGPARRARPLRPFGLRSAGAVGAPAVRGGVRHPRHRDLRDDRGGQHDHRQPAGGPAQGRARRACRPARKSGSPS